MPSEPTHQSKEPTHDIYEPPPEAEDQEVVPGDAEPASADQEITAQESPVLEAEAPPLEQETGADDIERPPVEHLLDAETTQPDHEPPQGMPASEQEPQFIDDAPQGSLFGPTPQVAPFAQLPPINTYPQTPEAGGSLYATPYPGPLPAEAPPIRPQPMLFGFPLKTVMTVALPLCVVTVVAAFFLLNNPGQDATPPAAAPVAVTAPAGAPTVSLTKDGAITPASTPVTLPAGNPAAATPPDSSGGGKSSTGSLVGRWEAKSGDFYEFRGDGGGVRGSAKSGKGAESFTWSTANNHVNLSVEQGVNLKKEAVGFSFGPDNKSLFLRQSGGHTREYSLATPG